MTTVSLLCTEEDVNLHSYCDSGATHVRFTQNR